MNTYTFTSEQLQQLLLSAITDFAGEDGVYDFSPTEANIRQVVVERTIAMTCPTCGNRMVKMYATPHCPNCNSQPQRDTLLENSLPAIDEDEDPDWWIEDSQATEHLRLISFDGRPTPYESDDNISPAELGLPPVA